MRILDPMTVSGPRQVDPERKVLWRQSVLIGDDSDESLVEISKTKNKFYIIAYNSGTMMY